MFSDITLNLISLTLKSTPCSMNVITINSFFVKISSGVNGSIKNETP